MLEPGDRSLLLDSLRPPEGYEVDFAIATTYSLDLLSLLVAPLGFTFFELENVGKGLEDVDPLVLLRTVRRYADRVSIFCQAGRIAVPPAQNLLYSHLEESIVQVSAPKPGRSFHPKVWVIRFRADGQPVRYRLLCLSRNLTFDRCWDVVARLDGHVLDRKLGKADNKPLADFIGALPRLATKPEFVTPRISEHVRVAAEELRKVEFDLPQGFDSLTFHPLGIPGYSKDPLTNYQYDRILAISPFVTADALREIADGPGESILVSRFEELEKVAGKDLRGFKQVFVLDDSTQQQEDVEAPVAELNSLHAKCYVVDHGWNASIILGSANATKSGFNGNVEFLVELGGRRKDVGVEAILAGEGEPSLRDMLRRYEPRADPAVDQLLEDLEDRVETVRSSLAATQWNAEVRPAGPLWSLRLAASQAIGNLDPSIKVSVRPLTIPSGAKRLEGACTAFDFGELGLESITAFFAFEVEAQSGGARCAIDFVLRADLTGVPADRKEQLLRYHLREPEQVLRFILLLLAWDKDGDGTDFEWKGIPGAGSDRWALGESEALLEPLLRALAENPAALDSVAETIDEIRKGGDAGVLPPGIDRVWDPVWQARSLLSNGGAQ